MKHKHNGLQLFFHFVFISLMFVLICMPTCLASECSHPSCTWKIDWDSMDVVSGTIWERKYCDECGKYTDLRMKTFSLHDNGRFLFTPNEFEERFSKISKIFAENYGANELKPFMVPLENGELCLALYDASYDLIAYIQFTDEKQYLNETEQDEAAISCVMGFLISEDATSWIDVMIPAFITCDNVTAQ